MDEVPMETESDMEGGFAFVIEGEGEETSDQEGEEAAVAQDVPAEQDDSLCSFEQHTDSVYAVDAKSTAGADVVLGASGGGDDKAYLWDLKTGQKKFDLFGHKDSVSTVQFNMDGSLLATASYDSTVKVWNTQDGSLIKSLEGPTEAMECITWHSKGNIILGGSSDASCWMWASNGTCLNVFYGHSAAVNTAIFSSDGKLVVTGSADASVRVWDPKTATSLQHLHGSLFHQS